MSEMFFYDYAWLCQHQAQHTASEIWQQPDLWQTLGDELITHKPDWFTFLAPILAQADLRIILSGAGSSAFVGRALAPWLREKIDRDVIAWGTTDIVAAPMQYLSASRPTLLVSFARSGDSPESLSSVQLADQLLPQCYHLIITCNPHSQLAQYAQDNPRACRMIMPEGSHDQSFAMTSSFSCMLLSAALMLAGETLPDWRHALQRMTDCCRQLRETLSPQSKKIASSAFQRYLVLGSGPFAGIAEEAALKMLELTAGKDMTRFDTPLGVRHGPKFMIDGQTLLVMMFSPDAYTRRYERDLWRELQHNNRALQLVGLSHHQHGMTDTLALHDDHEALWMIFPYLLFLQMLAFERSLHHQLSPDNPSPNGEVNRVVQGVVIYPFHGSDVSNVQG